MESNICVRCGGSEFIEKNGHLICCYCRATYEKKSTRKGVDTVISVKNDIDDLLKKCRLDPAHASRYAALVLDIDPRNEEAQKYL